MLNGLTPPGIHGEPEAGRTFYVRKQLMLMTEDIKERTFDLAELLAEANDNKMYTQWGYTSINKYAEQELGIRERKSQYLIKIINTCAAVGIKRSNFEGVGISKLRTICSLDPNGSFFNPETKTPEPLNEHIVHLISKAEEMTGTQVLEAVRKLMGQTGENRPVTKMMSWTESTYLNVILPAQELARRRLGSAKRDENGNAVEYSDSVVEEVIHAEFLNDPNQQPEEVITVEEALKSVPVPIPTETL